MRHRTAMAGAAALAGLLAAAPAIAQTARPASQVFAKPPMGAWLAAPAPIVANPPMRAAPPPALDPSMSSLTTTPSCDPNGGLLDRAEILTTLGQFDDAVTVANRVLAAAPQDFRAGYVKGKALFLKAAVHDPNRWNPPLPLSATMAAGIDTLRGAAGLLSKLDQACAVSTNAYSILNTIGAFYLSRGYFKEAQSYLLQAYDAYATVTKDTDATRDTKRKVCDNLGLVYLVQLQPDPALRYYGESLKKYNSTVAAAQIKKAMDLKRAFFSPLTAK